MRDLTIALTQGAPKRKTKNPAAVFRLNLAILVCTMLIGGTYLFQINILGTKGYEIKQLEQKVKQLESERKHLEMEASSLQSINRIQSEATRLNFVPTTSVTYIKDSDFALK
jgi:hypothetical protein